MDKWCEIITGSFLTHLIYQYCPLTKMTMKGTIVFKKRVKINSYFLPHSRMIKPSDCAHACSKMPKCMSWTTNGPTSCLLKDKMPLHAWATGIVSGLKGEWSVKDSMLTCHRPGFFPQSGSTTLYAVDDENSSGSFAVADDFGDIWKNFSNTGEYITVLYSVCDV